MSGLDDEQDEEKREEGDEATESAEDESGDLEGAFEEELDEEDADGFSDDAFDSDEDLKVVDEVLSHKDQNARALAIRRAIEERLEAKRLSKDLDYLDLDSDD